MDFSSVEINCSLPASTAGGFLSLTSPPSYLANFLGQKLDSDLLSDSNVDSLKDANPELKLIRYLLHNVELYFIPVIALVGLLTNTLNFVVFIATHLKRHSCNIYLASLAIADNVFLICVLLSWSENIHVNLLQLCGVSMYLKSVSRFLSIWYVVTFSVELYVSLCFPLKRDRLCNTKVAKMVVVGLASIALLVHGCLLFTSGSVTVDGVSLCGPLPQYIGIVSVLYGVDAFLTVALPTIIICGCNIRIAYVVWSFYREHSCQLDGGSQPMQRWHFGRTDANWIKYKEEALEGTPGGRLRTNSYVCVSGDASGAKPTPAFIKRTLHMRATRMLLIVSTVFLLCNMPSQISRLCIFFNILGNNRYVPTPAFVACQGLFQIIYYLNFTMKFFIYPVSGRSFRLGLMRLVSRIRTRRGDEKCNSLYNKPAHGRQLGHF